MKNYWLYYILAIGCCILAFLAPLIFAGKNYHQFDDNSTTIANTIAGLTAPFLSMAGSILVFAALRAQIDANKAVQDQFEKQEKDNSERDFTNTFFQMLNIHHQLINNMMATYRSLFENIPREERIGFTKLSIDWGIIQPNVGKIELKGKDLFDKSFQHFEFYLSNEIDSHLPSRIKGTTFARPINEIDKLIEILNPGYEHFYRKLNSNFGNYFRNLYRIIKQIDEFNFNENPDKDFEKKYYYTSIIRAQLSNSEVKWLMFNGLMHYGKKFKPLIEKYSLLKILMDNNSRAISEYKQLYHQSAFDNKIKSINNNVS